jgi:hypothetical protein
MLSDSVPVPATDGTVTWRPLRLRAQTERTGCVAAVAHQSSRTGTRIEWDLPPGVAVAGLDDK